MKWLVKSLYTKDFLRGVGRSKLTFETKKEARRYIRNAVINEKMFKPVKKSISKRKSK